MLRDLAIIGAVGALGYIAWLLLEGEGGFDMGTGQVNGTAAAGGGSTPFASYLAKLAHAESSGNPLAKAATSSASGLYQFTRAVWLAFGGTWGNDPTKPFGGAQVSIAEQTARITHLTAQNAAQLAAAGIAATNQALYAAHFLGPATAIHIFASPPTAKLVNLLSSAVINANPFLTNWTVADFMGWLDRKMG